MQLTWNCQHKEMETKFIAVRSISNSLLGKKKVEGSFASDKSQSGIGLDGAVRSTSDNSDGVADSVL